MAEIRNESELDLSQLTIEQLNGLKEQHEAVIVLKNFHFSFTLILNTGNRTIPTEYSNSQYSKR